MTPIISYRLVYTPGGNGSIDFLLQGEHQPRHLGGFPPEVFTALAVLLAQKNLAFDGQRFISADRNDLLPPQGVPLVAGN